MLLHHKIMSPWLQCLSISLVVCNTEKRAPRTIPLLSYCAVEAHSYTRPLIPKCIRVYDHHAWICCQRFVQEFFLLSFVFGFYHHGLLLSILWPLLAPGNPACHSCTTTVHFMSTAIDLASHAACFQDGTHFVFSFIRMLVYIIYTLRCIFSMWFLSNIWRLTTIICFGWVVHVFEPI